MTETVYRCYVEKRPGLDAVAKAVEAELADALKLPEVHVRQFYRWDVQGIPRDRWQEICCTVLSDPASDVYSEDTLPAMHEAAHILAIEPLPGQFDIRGDTCEQCIQMLLGGEKPNVRTAILYAIEGVDQEAFAKVKSYLANPLEYREALLEKPSTLLSAEIPEPEDIPVIEGFTSLDDAGLAELGAAYGLAMSLADLHITKAYFLDEQRDPTLTEIKVIDTYWSDHCRHTTFNTMVNDVDIQDERVTKAYELFLSVNEGKPVSLMRIATAAMRHLRAVGGLPMYDETEETNACTIRVNVECPEGIEEWLLYFKNETHNHPTEMEPYGGASTCIGGAIRDPMSGRGYVYQGMRITGAGDPRKPVEGTLPGKLPQRKLTTTAVEGFTSYSNRIGLAAGLAKELYHEGYIAKRMEAGAVVAAAPLSSVRRERPASGDVVVLLGGPTGRDGIGGATGSSKTHDEATVVVSAAEVQKGNPPEERKIVRMFRNPEITGLIKRCNDFGAGGVSVAVGELADGLDIELDAVPVKYEGLDGTEIALSESQERMAVVVAESDLPAFLKHAESENAPATVIAKVTEEKRLVMRWRGKTIVDIARDFLDINGADRYAAVRIPGNAEGGAAGAAGFAGADGADAKEAAGSGTLEERLSALAGDLGFCSQKGIAERFDSTVGAASVFVPYGGKYGLTETQVMAALLPKEGVSTASVMSFGFDPYHTEADPFGGSVFAVVSSVAKLIASGVPLDTVHLSLQEFFPSLGDDPHRWGLPFSAMLGAFSAQMGLGIAAIGGKDSMSGSFGELDVPPTLISFAIGVQDAGQLISPEFKEAGHPVYLLETPMGSDGLPDYAALQKAWSEYAGICRSGKVLSAWACEESGVYGGLIKMALGNMIGFTGDAEEAYFSRKWGSILFEAGEALDGFPLVGYTQAAPAFSLGDIQISLDGVRMAWESTLEGIFPTRIDQAGEAPLITDQRKPARRSASPIARPKAVLPIFPSTFSEYDTAAAITRAGGTYEYALIRNLTPEALEASVIHLAKAIADAQMVVFPGGFSGGDDPDGAGRYIAALFRHPRLSEAVHDLLQRRDGLILGIGNGFQALLKLGLLPSGAISPAEAVSAAGAGSPGLATNQIGRHQGKYVSTRVASVLSPWLSQCRPGEVYLQPVSYGEGRFVATDAALEALRANGQIAFQYVDHTGAPSMDVAFNPGGSVWAVEGVSSPDGRVLGKMAHPERDGRYVAQNIPGVIPIPLFAGGVHYFA